MPQRTRICRNCLTLNGGKAKQCQQCGQEIPEAVEIFFSYAREDKKLVEKLIRHLSPMKRRGLVKIWYDQEIRSGSEWSKDIDEHLKFAEIILLLISDSFIASDYIWTVELKNAMERHERGEACVIPVILRAADWHKAPFGAIQALPTDAKPVVLWPDQDTAWVSVVKGIRRVIEENYIS